MSDTLEIRESTAGDIAPLEALYPEAFPLEDLLPLVRALLGEPAGVLSLVAATAGALAGHVMFNECGIDNHDRKVALLGPLAVAPAMQRRGVGSALVGAGLEQLKAAEFRSVYVLGDPAYYGRFGFVAEGRVKPPYALPDEWAGAWQSLELGGEGALPPQGTLAVPTPWRDRALWAP